MYIYIYIQYNSVSIFSVYILYMFHLLWPIFHSHVKFPEGIYPHFNL